MRIRPIASSSSAELAIRCATRRGLRAGRERARSSPDSGSIQSRSSPSEITARTPRGPKASRTELPSTPATEPQLRLIHKLARGRRLNNGSLEAFCQEATGQGLGGLSKFDASRLITALKGGDR